MARKIKKEELKNVSGGSAGDQTAAISYTCPNEKCHKKFTLSEAKKDIVEVYCPYCGTFVGLIPM